MRIQLILAPLLMLPACLFPLPTSAHDALKDAREKLKKPDTLLSADQKRRASSIVAQAKKRFLGSPAHSGEYKFRLLLDLSGSMAGEPLDHTLQATALAQHVFEALGIDYSIVGFSDQPILLKDFSPDPSNIKRSSPTDKKAVLARAANSGGGPSWDGEALLASLEGKDMQGLKNQPGRNRYLLVLTDGAGYSHGKNDPFFTAIKLASNMRVEIIAIGPVREGRYIALRYPQYLLFDDVTSMPEKTGNLLEAILTKGSARSALAASGVR